MIRWWCPDFDHHSFCPPAEATSSVSAVLIQTEPLSEKGVTTRRTYWEEITWQTLEPGA